MKKTTFFLAFLFSTLIVEAQITFKKTFGGSNTDYGQSVLQTNDGGYIVTGAFTTSADNSDIFLLKTDEMGNQVWMETYGDEFDEYGISVKQTADNGYFITGNHDDDWGIGNDIIIVKTDENGNLLFTKTFGNAGVDEIANDCQQTNDNGYIITGSIGDIGEMPDYVLLMKLDESGDTLWTKTYGGEYSDWGVSVQQTNDYGYIISGTTYSYGIAYINAYLIKTDEMGDTLWTKTYEAIRGGTVLQTDEGGYMISCYTPNHFLTKTDSNGDTLWTRTYTYPGYYEYPVSIVKTSDNNYLMVSNLMESPTPPFKGFLIRKIDPDGNILWTNAHELGNNDFSSSHIEETSDEGFIITGREYNDTKGSYDIFLIKTNENGLLGTGEKFDNTFSGKIYPNPSNGLITLEFGKESRHISSIEIVNLNGQTIYQRTIDNNENDILQIDLSNYRKGMLYLKLLYDNTFIIEKIIVH